MSDHPTTYAGSNETAGGIAWEDRAALHRADDQGGLLDSAKALRKGTFAEMIAHVMLLPEKERRDYVIEKLGDREYHLDEIKALSRLPDYPQI